MKIIKTPFLDVSCDDGSCRIYESDLPHITKADLKMLVITRKVLRDRFAEGVRLMQGQDWAQCRPAPTSTSMAQETLSSSATTNTPIH